MNEFKTYTFSPEEKQGIVSAVRIKLEQHPEIVFAYIFGSFVDPEMPFFRDIDIGVYLDERVIQPKEFLNYSINLSLEMERELQRFPAEVVIINRAPLALVFNITKGELLFTKEEEIWLSFVVKTWALYHDHAISSRTVLEDIVSP